MAAINIKIIAPWGGAPSGQIGLDPDLPVRNVISEVGERLGWSSGERLSSSTGLFTRQPPRLWLYAPRWGVLDEDKTLGELDVKEGTVLCLYASPPKSAEFALSAIHLAHGEPLSAVGRCVVVEWQGRMFPVVLPANVAPQGDDGVLWLLDVIGRQIADITGQTISPLDWAMHRCYNVQKQEWISFTEKTIPLGEQLSHGDHLRLVGADEIVILDEARGVEEMDDRQPLRIRVDDDLLGQIRIEEESEAGTTVAITLANTRLELIKGDLTQQTTDAIVNAAKSELTGGGGVDGAIHRAAGPALARASRALAPCPPGEAVITPGFRLPCRWVIHTVGPVFEGGSKGEAEVLASAYRNSLKLAINSRFTSIAFPSISTGAYGYPVSQAARIALGTVIEVIRQTTTLELVRFVLFSDSDYRVYRDTLKNLAADLSTPVEESDVEP